MKRALIHLIILCFALAAGAKDKEVVIAYQYTRAQKMKIPEKTMEAKLQNITFRTQKGDSQQAASIKSFLESVISDDFEHYIFSLSLQPSAQETQVTVQAFDPFNEPAETLTGYLGAVKVAHCYFLVKSDPSCDQLLKSVFTKDKGKTCFVRVFELVQSKTELHDTHAIATYSNGALKTSSMVICGENKQSEKN